MEEVGNENGCSDGTHNAGHQVREVQAVFGHDGPEDLRHRLGGLGLQAHRAVYRHQVQSGGQQAAVQLGKKAPMPKERRGGWR